MEWPKEIHPVRTRYAILEGLRKMNLLFVVILLLSGYICLNILFGLLYYKFEALNNCAEFIDYIYFSFVAGTTIGFGDFHPINSEGKFITIFQGISSTFYFAMMVAFLGVKFLFPNHTLHFSDKILFDGEDFMFRILNSHRGLLVNPEIRIGVVAHSFGNVIAPTISIKKVDTIHWLDNHDFTIRFPNKPFSGFCVHDEWLKAMSHTGEESSRFKIRISVSGSYGMQQYIQVVNYGGNDVAIGSSFKPIQYNDEDKKVWRNIKFTKFGNFWGDFNGYNGDI
jgi:hypothetical protein